MEKSLFHDGHDLFNKFKLSVESEITYIDFCKEMIFLHKDIKFTTKALLMLYPADCHDDWIEAESIEFCPWDSVYNIQNVDGITILEEFDHAEIVKWLMSLPSKNVKYPFLHVRTGSFACIFEGVPKSARSKGGKQRLKEEVNNLKSSIQRSFPTPDPDHVEMMIDIFSSNPEELPDVDRLSISIMDAFEGIVYLSDKQIRLLQPRVFESEAVYEQFEWRGEPIPHGLEIKNIPAGSLYPLATGVLDYYVVRIITYYR
jgi:hypothetical protein